MIMVHSYQPMEEDFEVSYSAEKSITAISGLEMKIESLDGKQVTNH